MDEVFSVILRIIGIPVFAAIIVVSILPYCLLLKENTIDKLWKHYVNYRLKQHIKQLYDFRGMPSVVVDINKQLDPKFKIDIGNKKELPYFSEIFEAYREWQMLLFLRNDELRWSVVKKKFKDFFLLTFNAFLNDRAYQTGCFVDSFGNDLEKMREYSIYEYSSVVDIECNITRYNLTDFGVVYYKVWLATEWFCEKENVEGSQCEHIVNALETRSVELMSFIP